jgi:hypothetical protein
MREKTGFLMAGLLMLGLAACSGTKTYVTDSRPLDRQIVIDGKSDDWAGALSFMEESKLEEGFLNDQNDLYMCLVTDDNALNRQIMAGGLTVWFDPQGGNAKVFGIRYPLGQSRLKPQAKPEEGQQTQGQSPPAGEESQEEAPPSLEILRAGNPAPQKIAVSDLKGIEVKFTSEEGVFVYELKVPLQPAADRTIAVGAQPGKTIGIGFEVPKMSLGRSEGDRSGGMGGGGMMGGRGGFGRGGMMGGRGGYGRGGAQNSQGPEGVNVWTYVKLSTGKTPSPVSRAEGPAIK